MLLRRAPVRSKLLAAGLTLCAQGALAAGLDVTTEHRLRALSYSHTSLLPGPSGQRSFLSQSTRLGLTIKNVDLGTARGESQTLDIVLKLRALGVQGSTTPLAAPFDRAAAHYPSALYTPFFENAALAAHRLGGFPWDVTFGRQSYTLGSGLLLDDNGAGLTGLSVRGRLPWWNMKADAFLFQAQQPSQGFSAQSSGFAQGSLDVAGWALELPSEGTWQLNQLIERDRRTQLAAPSGCPPAVGAVGTGCLVGKATRVLTSLRYQLRYGPLVFDGEGAWQKGAATPTGAAAAGNHVTYNGNAQVLKAKWRQTFYRSKETGKKIEGLARMSFARGSGDDPATATTDEAFFPSNGRRFDGLEREGFGEFFAATPYDAFGGHTRNTASGLPAGVSGIIALGFGATPPAWHGWVLDVDQYLYQADRAQANRALGKELDIRLRHDIRDRFSLKLSGAFYSTGSAINVSKPSARRYLFEASGKF
jgi:hypothetical protein